MFHSGTPDSLFNLLSIQTRKTNMQTFNNMVLGLALKNNITKSFRKKLELRKKCSCSDFLEDFSFNIKHFNTIFNFSVQIRNSNLF